MESDTVDSEESGVVQNLRGKCNIKYVRESQCSVNPFAESDDDVYEFKDDDPVCSVNPFSSDENKQFKPQKMSSLKACKDSNHQCSLCEKTLTTKYNLKLHLVQVHRVKVPNMSVYQCPSCDFITGSKICFVRHRETHSSKKSKKAGEAILCNICHESFANSSSLRRHKRRKHDDNL